MATQAQQTESDRFYWEELSPVPDCPIAVFNVRDKKTLTPMHSHTYLEIALVVSGTGAYTSPREEFSIKRGDLFLLCPEHRHSYTFQENLVVYNLLLKDSSVLKQHLELAQEPALRVFFDLEPRFRSNDRFQKHVHLTIEQVETLAEIMEQMEHELKTQGLHFKSMLNLLLKRFLILLCRYYTSMLDVKNDHLFALANVLQYMESKISTRITCEDLARYSNMTSKTFYRYFKTATGMAPIDYLVDMRLKRARQMLEETSLPVKQIADQCGFSNTSYFGQQFRRAFGCSPGKFRKADA